MLSKEDLDIHKKRNIGIIAHIDAGKTTTTERILFFTKEIRKMGEVHDGSTTTDYMPQERERGITIVLATIQCNWAEHVINIVDTPGHVDFSVEVSRSLRVMDGAVAVFDGVIGVEPQSENVWKLADKYGLAKLCYVNKMDRIGASFEKAVSTIKNKLSQNAIPIQLAYFEDGEYKGLYDLVKDKLFCWNSPSQMYATEISFSEMNDFQKTELTSSKTQMLNELANHSEAIFNHVLNGTTAPNELIAQEVRRLTISRKIFPILCGSSFKNKGVPNLLDAVTEFLPSPYDKEKISVEVIDEKTSQTTTKQISYNPDQPMIGLVFKTIMDQFLGQLSFVRIFDGKITTGDLVYNSRTGKSEKVAKIVQLRAGEKITKKVAYAGDIVALPLEDASTADVISQEKKLHKMEGIYIPKPVVEFTIIPKTNEDKNKLSTALRLMQKEDPAIRVSYNKETGETIVATLGELHMEIKVSVMKTDYGVEVTTSSPRITYRETIRKPTQVRETLRKQTGGSGMFAEVDIAFTPIEIPEECDHEADFFEFVDLTKGGSVPIAYIPYVKKGLEEGIKEGMLTKGKIIGLKAELKDGKHHPVDSNGLAFQMATQAALRKAMQDNTNILEPIVAIKIQTPYDYFNTVVGDVNAKGGTIDQVEDSDENKIVSGTIPLKNVFGYSTALRSYTKGKGSIFYNFKGWRKTT